MARAEERKAEGRHQGRGSPCSSLETASADAKAKLDAAAAAKDAAKAADDKKAAAAKAASEAKLALEPVSIYISRATQKLYVRRNTHKPAPDGGGEVFDSTIEVPVTIRDPDNRSARMFSRRWRATTPACAGPRSRSTTRTTPRTRSTASPSQQDVLDRIAPTALPRSSIIVSDEPLSRETNYRTEFVAVLSNQPRAAS